LFPCKWHQHVEAWLANPHQAAMITIRYEVLKRDPAAELRRFCEFAGIKRSAEFLEQVADGTAFEKMQRKERVQGVGDPQWPKEKLFRRRGAVGSYKEEMPGDILQAFLGEANDVLHQCGYL
ncbi:MAG: sulfotransferase domain-containing protein, partial [Verrucomicrobia bacterium]|nr:sulfotransferase domain-containing protein [Verrucomicrobiota bacterium]